MVRAPSTPAIQPQKASVRALPRRSAWVTPHSSRAGPTSRGSKRSSRGSHAALATLSDRFADVLHDRESMSLPLTEP
jgi:hypothetical protein